MPQGFCRDCRNDVADDGVRCPSCRSPRLLRHADLDTLAIAHVDCDAFYATIEKRDDPVFADKPVIVGGGQRGVVLTACYVARTYGVRSAMPMFEARRLCPHASVVRPDMAKYAEAGRAVRARMYDLTPLVEPVSIDEAFMDLPARPAARHGAGESARGLRGRVETRSASPSRSASRATSFWPRSHPTWTSRAATPSSASARRPPFWRQGPSA